MDKKKSHNQGPKVTSILNITWQPGWNPKTEQGHYVKIKEIWTNYYYYLHNNKYISISLH